MDAENLARLARLDPKLLYPVKHRGEQSQAHMALIRSRQALVASRTQLVNHVPKGRSSPSGAACPSALPGASTTRRPSTSPRRFWRPWRAHPPAEIGSLTQRIRDYEKQLEKVSEEHYPETGLLRQVEGVGPLTALTFVLTLEDPYRFLKSRSVGAYLGLVPATDRSGNRDPREKRISIRRATRC